MSSTTIYKIGNNPEAIGDTQNGHRSAMYVWNQLAKKYFGQDHFPMFDDELSSKVWNAQDHAEITGDEHIVLLSTMDKSVVNKSGLPRLIEAFESYGKEHDRSSFLEQAELLKDVELNNNQFIAWQQTSCGEFWAEKGFDDESDEYVFYDPNEGDVHFNIIDEFNEFQKEAKNGSTD